MVMKEYSIETKLTFDTLITAKSKEEALKLAQDSFKEEYGIDVEEDECKVEEM